MARAPCFDHDQRAGEHRRRLVAGRGKHQMDRLLDGRALGDVNERAVAHQRGVERRPRPRARSATTLPRCAATSGSPAASACAIERMVRPGDRFCRSDNSGTNTPSTNTMRRTSMSPIRRPASFARALAAASGAPAQRAYVSHQRAQIGVFPLLDPPARQAGVVELPERRLAQRRDLAVAGQLGLRRGIGLRERQLGTGLHVKDFGIHDASAASSWYSA